MYCIYLNPFAMRRDGTHVRPLSTAVESILAGLASLAPLISLSLGFDTILFQQHDKPVKQVSIGAFLQCVTFIYMLRG